MKLWVVGWFDLNEIRNFLKIIFEWRGETGWYYLNWMWYCWTIIFEWMTSDWMILFEWNDKLLNDKIWMKLRVIGWFDLNEIRNLLKIIFEWRGEVEWYYLNWIMSIWMILFELNEIFLTIRFEWNYEWLDDIIWIE
jgi:hypothetical protein